MDNMILKTLYETVMIFKSLKFSIQKRHSYFVINRGSFHYFDPRVKFLLTKNKTAEWKSEETKVLPRFNACMKRRNESYFDAVTTFCFWMSHSLLTYETKRISI